MTGVFRTTRKRVTVVEEQIVYTFNELIADIGGGLGPGAQFLGFAHIVSGTVHSGRSRYRVINSFIFWS